MEHLITKYLNAKLSKKERKQLKSWVKKNPEHLKIFKERIQSHAYVIPLHFDADKAFEKFYNQLQLRKQGYKRRIRILSAAASFIALVSLGLAYFNSHPLIQEEDKITTTEKGFKEIQLTLPDGSQQIIDKKSKVPIKSKDGQLIANKTEDILDFSSFQKKEEDTSITQLDIPYGEKLKIKLSDGTLVWLNSGTRFKFPQTFDSSTKKRQVEVIGEAYFEVAHNAKVPFLVSTPSVNVKVLGTHFNISSYANDSKTETTLMEGSVSVEDSKSYKTSLILKPNQQAVYEKTDAHLGVIEVNANDFRSWIDDILVVDSLTFLELKNKLERKYNVTISSEIEELWSTEYRGEFQDESLKETLETIALSSSFDYQIDGKHVKIFSKAQNTN